MSTCLMVIDDQREDYLDRCLGSASQYLPPLDVCVMVSDPDHELGFAGAIQAGWDGVLEAECEWVVHLESDFTFNGPVPLDRMRRLLERRGDLAQVVLKRQAWNKREARAGGIVEADPDDFTGQINGYDTWTLHRRFFSTNPSLYRTELCERGWPQVPESEGIFTHQLLADDYSFALWGAPFDSPLVTHIGVHRTGNGY